MSQEEFISDIAKSLESCAIPFMMSGSHASSFYGKARATNDVDFVADPSAQQLDQLITILGDRYYVSPAAAREALHGRSMFNIINIAEGWKADIIIRKERPFSVEELNRRQIGRLYGRSIPIASAEDVILSKLVS